MMFTDEQKKLLNDKLESSAVKKPTGKFGPKGDYIEGWHAIAEANRIFGFDGWSYRIVDMKECHEPTKNEKGNFGVSFIARVEVSAGGVIREDIGYGSGFAGQIGDAYESATKEAITDSLKRTLRSFGNPFGLALYDKSRENVTDGTDKRPTEQARPQQAKPVGKSDARPLYTTLEADMRRNKSTRDLAAWWKDSECREKRAALPDDWRGNLHDAFVDYGFELKAKEQLEAASDGFPGSMTDSEALQHSMASG